MKTIYSFVLIFVLYIVKAQSLDWVSLPQELNGDVRDMVVYNGQLIACGRFTASGSTPLRNIAAWDGSQWTNLGKGFRANYVNGTTYLHKLLVFNNELYVVGRFDSAGTVASKNIARWDGMNWSSLTTYVNDEIFTIAAFNNEIYVGGRFGAMENIFPARIAKYNGITWQTVGSGIANVPGYTVNEFCIYNNKLYVSGFFTGAGGISANNIASWDGSVWQGLSNSNSSPGYDMIEWESKLLLANTNTAIEQIEQWNNSSWSVFSQQNMCFIESFHIFNNRLYCSGSITPAATDGNSIIYVWEPDFQTWSKIGTGINNSVLSFCEYKGELYCGGTFKTSDHSYHNYIAKLSTINGLNKNTINTLGLKISPTPATDQLTLTFANAGSRTITLCIINTLGQTVLNTQVQVINNKADSDISFLKSGIYYLKAETGKGSGVVKFIKQ